MNTLITDKKYTVMLSAYQDDNDLLVNLINTEVMRWHIEHAIHAHPIRAVSVYHGCVEQSFIIHTNSSNVVTELKQYALDVFNQECVLVSNNRRHDVQLHNSNATTTHIGHVFKLAHKAPKNAVSYTILNGCDYWNVN